MEIIFTIIILLQAALIVRSSIDSIRRSEAMIELLEVNKELIDISHIFMQREKETYELVQKAISFLENNPNKNAR